MCRALRKVQAIRDRFGGSANTTEPFPERPKGMHHETRWRLRGEHDEAEMAQLAGTRDRLGTLEQRTG